MPVLSIIACDMLEDELAYVLSKDIEQLILVEKRDFFGLQRKLKYLGCLPVLIPLDLECQLYFLKDDKGEIVEDCISVVLGGNKAYAEAMANSEGEGMFYLTPMWTSGRMEIPKEMISELLELGKMYMKKQKLDAG